MSTLKRWNGTEWEYVGVSQSIEDKIDEVEDKADEALGKFSHKAYFTLQWEGDAPTYYWIDESQQLISTGTSTTDENYYTYSPIPSQFGLDENTVILMDIYGPGYDISFAEYPEIIVPAYQTGLKIYSIMENEVKNGQLVNGFFTLDGSEWSTSGYPPIVIMQLVW